MLLSAPWYDSGTLWTGLLVPVTVIGVVVTFWIGFFPAKGRLLYSMPLVESLVRSRAKAPNLKVVYDGTEVAEPHLVTVRLASRGRKDIEFYKSQPIVLNMNTPIVDVLATAFSTGAPRLDVSIDGLTLKIGPEPGNLIRKGETITITMLVNGSDIELNPEFPFKDVVDQKQGDDSDPRWLSVLGALLIIIFTIIIVLAGQSNADRNHRILNAIGGLFVAFALGTTIWLVTTAMLWLRRRRDR
jgi:hypothetical protein